MGIFSRLAKSVSRLIGSNVGDEIQSVGGSRRSRASYDAARSSDDFDNYWANADGLDADAANSRAVRHKLIARSRYEVGSNGYYAGILSTHVNMLVGVGPSLRMLTGSRSNNQAIEKAWHEWSQAIKLRQKLWTMGKAVEADGECFAVHVQNPLIIGPVQLDLRLIEAEQVQTPFGTLQRGYTDGIRWDEFDNPIWYDILPQHPGSTFNVVQQQPIRVSASDVLHWFKVQRPGQHRGIPALTSTLNCGASSRRMREATVAAVETAASPGAILKTNAPANGEAVNITAGTKVDLDHRSLIAMPGGWDFEQMESKHPNAQYSDFLRGQIGEQGRPLSQPYNVAAADSSTYSFASGKLDTLAYRAALDVERQDCNLMVLDPLFSAFWREYTFHGDRRFDSGNIPTHQWDWPAHPIIDVQAEATATDVRLKNGTTTLRQVYSDNGLDFEDELAVMAEDTFGIADESSIEKCRQIQLLRNTSKDALPFVAQLLGIELPKPEPPAANAQPQNQDEGVPEDVPQAA